MDDETKAACERLSRCEAVSNAPSLRADVRTLLAAVEAFDAERCELVERLQDLGDEADVPHGKKTFEGIRDRLRKDRTDLARLQTTLEAAEIGIKHLADTRFVDAAENIRLKTAFYSIRLFAEEGEAMPEDINNIIDVCKDIEDLLPKRGSQ